MDWIQQWQSKLNKQNGVAPLVRTGGSRHTGLAALPHRNIQQIRTKPRTPSLMALPNAFPEVQIQVVRFKISGSSQSNTNGRL